MMPFIEDFMEVTKEAESPRSFFYWSAIAAISAVIRKNAYINKRIYRLYPNLYIMLIAKSGLRKGFPVKLSQKVVEELEITKVISGQNSIQAIVNQLSKQWTLESGKVLNKAHTFVVNDELDALLISDSSAQTTLTTLYDSFYHDKWAKTLKKDAQEVLDDVYVTMLTATNPTHLDSFLDATSTKGGFLGRTLMIYEERKSRINPLIEENDAFEIDKKPLIAYLKTIADYKGQFKFDGPAVKYYKKWYIDFYNRLQDENIEDDTGTAERAGDTVLKLSMILSLNEGSSLIITTPHIEKSIELFYDATKSVKRVVEGKGASEASQKTRVVLDYLLSKDNFTATRQQVLSAKYGDVDAIDLDRVIDTLQQAGIIEVDINKKPGPTYQLSARYAEKVKARLK